MSDTLVVFDDPILPIIHYIRDLSYTRALCGGGEFIGSIVLLAVWHLSGMLSKLGNALGGHVGPTRGLYPHNVRTCTFPVLKKITSIRRPMLNCTPLLVKVSSFLFMWILC